MSKYVIELESLKTGLLTLMNETQSHIHLDMSPAGPGRPSRIVITSEQFKMLAYDIEGHSEGTHGVRKDLQIWVRDLDSNQADRVSYQDALWLLAQAALDDAAAAEVQAKTDAEIEAERAKRLAEKQAAQLAGGSGEGLAGGVERSLEALVES